MSFLITLRNSAGHWKNITVYSCYTEVTQKPDKNNKKKGKYMKKNNSLPIESVTFEYVGTDKQFNEFLRSVIRDYVSDDKTLPPQKPSDHNEQSIA